MNERKLREFEHLCDVFEGAAKVAHKALRISESRKGWALDLEDAYSCWRSEDDPERSKEAAINLAAVALAAAASIEGWEEV